MLDWVANGPQQLSGATHTCITTTVGRVCASSFLPLTYLYIILYSFLSFFCAIVQKWKHFAEVYRL